MSYFRLKDGLDAVLYRAFNLISDVRYGFDFPLKRVLAENAAFERIHEGDRCFILGTGPSMKDLTERDVLLLANENLLAVNSFYKIDFLSKLMPKYYFLLDNNYWGVADYTFRDIKAFYGNSVPVVVTDVRARRYVEEAGLNKRMLLYSKNYPVNEMRFRLHENSSITMNVVSTAIMAAIYMGFKEIYLLGCDYNLFCSRVGTHCYDDGDEIDELPSYNLAFYLKYYHLTTEFHYLLSKLAKKNGVSVVNLTSGSLLDAYPMKRLSDVI